MAKAAFLAAIVSLAAPHALAQSTPLVWESRFEQTFAPGTEYPGLEGAAFPSATLTVAPGGDLYFHALDRLGEPTVSRLRADYSTVWRRAAPLGSGLRYVLDSMSLRDGGTLVISNGLSRFSPDGELLWSRPLTTERPGAVLEYRNGDLAVVDSRVRSSGYSKVLRVDASTGTLIASTMIDGRCDARLLGVSDDTLYVSACDGYIHRLDGELETIWRVPGGGPFGVADASGVYYRSTRSDGSGLIVKLAAASGGLVWRRNDSPTRLSLDAAGHLLGRYQDASLERLDSIDTTTGHLRWSSSWSAVDLTVAVADDALYVAGSRAQNAPGFIASLDPGDGALRWSTDLHVAGSNRRFLPRAALVNDQGISVSGSDCASVAWCRIGLVHVDPVTGTQSTVTYPDVPQTVGVSANMDGNGALILASAEGSEGEQHVRARQLSSNGATDWQRLLAVSGAERGLETADVVRRSDGDVLLSANDRGLTFPYLARYGADGTLAWSRDLSPEGHAGAALGFSLDGDENLIVRVTRIIDYFGHIERFAEKFDAAIGETRWSIPLPSGGGTEVPSAYVFGTDLIVPRSLETYGYARFSGVDASLRWTDISLETSHPTLFAADGEAAYATLQVSRVAAFSSIDGSTRWVRDLAADNAELLWLKSLMVGDDGDVYVSGVRISTGGFPAVVVRLDGRSGAPVWMQRFEKPTGLTAMEAALRHVGNGEVWLTQSDGLHTFLARLDADSGEVIDGSLLDVASKRDELTGSLGLRYGRRSADGTLLVYGLDQRPGHAAVPWAGQLPAPDSGMRGNLTTRFEVTQARLGWERLSVTFVNQSQVTLDNASGYVQFGEYYLDPMLPYLATARDIACVVSGGGVCIAAPTPNGIRVSLNLQPGAEAHLTASAHVMGETPMTMFAEVYAPYGFFETDLLDNRRSQPLGDRLFVDGFESP